MAAIKSDNFVYLLKWEELTIGVFSTPAKAAAAKREFIEREGFDYDEEELDIEAVKVDEVDDEIFRTVEDDFKDENEAEFAQSSIKQAPLSIRITSWLLIGLLVVTLLLGVNSCVRGIYHLFAH